MSLASDVLACLSGRTLVTAESITGGGIGSVLTSVPGASAVYKGGIVSYCDAVKASVLGVDPELLLKKGAVCPEVALQMAIGARKVLHSNVAVSVTGLAGPDGDAYGHPVGTAFIGYADGACAISRGYRFEGDREAVRRQTVRAALELILEHNR